MVRACGVHRPFECFGTRPLCPYVKSSGVSPSHFYYCCSFNNYARPPSAVTEASGFYIYRNSPLGEKTGPCRKGARKGTFSKLDMACKEQLGRGEEYNPALRTGDPCANPIVEGYLAFTAAEQKRVG